MPMDKMEAHLRQQLSAMMDGELAAEEARFLFRRLQHDRDLAGCWERWQLCSVLMRGEGTAMLLPEEFSRRVANAVGLESTGVDAQQAFAATGTHPRRWAWWGGGAALAASLALLVVVPRPASGPAQDRSDPARVASATSPTPLASSPQAISPDASHSPASPLPAAQLATALAMAEAPRRIAARRNRAAMPDADRAQPQPSRGVETTDSGQRIAVAESQSMNLPTRANPFAAQDTAQARPWPRAVLPGTGTGAFSASYSTGATSSFYPFEPRNAPLPEPQATTGDSAQP